MDAGAMPIIRLEVTQMKAAIMHHLGIIGSELGDSLSAEIDKAVASYPWEAQVKKIVHDAIDNHVENYFKWGKGAEVVREVIDDSFEKHLRSN